MGPEKHDEPGLSGSVDKWASRHGSTMSTPRATPRGVDPVVHVEIGLRSMHWPLLKIHKSWTHQEQSPHSLTSSPQRATERAHSRPQWISEAGLSNALGVPRAVPDKAQNGQETKLGGEGYTGSPRVCWESCQMHTLLPSGGQECHQYLGAF
jgi:hypothetical protein